MGEGSRERDPGSLVPGRRGWIRSRRNRERSQQPRGSAARDILSGCTSVTAFRGLLHEGTYLPVLPEGAVVAVRLWIELYDIQVQRVDVAGRTNRSRRS